MFLSLAEHYEKLNGFFGVTADSKNKSLLVNTLYSAAWYKNYIIHPQVSDLMLSQKLAETFFGGRFFFKGDQLNYSCSSYFNNSFAN